MKNEGIVIREQTQPQLWLLRDHLRPMLDPQRTGREFAISITRLHPGDGPPPHIHRNEDEGFYILEGEVTFLRGDSLIVAGPGNFVWGPRDTIHTFKCTSKTPAKMLLIVTPTQFMDFAMTLAVPATDFMQPPAITPELIGRLMSAAPQFGIEIKPDHPMPATSSAAPGPSKRLWVMGEHVSYLATGPETNGKFTIIEAITAPGGGPPAHVHLKQDEVFYVIEGEHTFFLDGTPTIAHAGDLVHIPHGVRHRFTNSGAAPGRLLNLHTPGGFEAFFDECGVDADLHATAPHTPPPPPEVLAALLARHDMTL